MCVFNTAGALNKDEQQRAHVSAPSRARLPPLAPLPRRCAHTLSHGTLTSNGAVMTHGVASTSYSSKKAAAR